MDSRAVVDGWGPPGSLRQAVTWSLGAGALSLVYSAFPYLFDDGHVIADILNSNTLGYVLGVTLLVLFTMLLMRGLRLRATEGRATAGFVLAMFGGFFMLGLAIILVFAGRDYRLAADLMADGVPAQARLSRTFVDSCGKSGCSSVLQYEFVPKGEAAAVHGSADEGDESPAYTYAVATRTVPILYDPADPRRSMVHWSDDIQQEASPRYLAARVAIVGGILLALMLVITLALRPAMRTIAAATAAKQGQI